MLREIPTYKKAKNSIPRNLLISKQQTFVPHKIGELSSSVSRTSIAIQRLEGLITKQQNRLDAIMTNIADGILILDKDGKPIIQNAIGKKYFVELCNCDTNPEKCTIHKTIKEIQKQALPTFTCELTANGKIYHLKFALVPQKGNSHKISLRISCFSKQAYNQYPTNTIPLIRKLVAAIAHEINNPLTPILGLSNPQSSKNMTSPELDKQLGIIHHAGERIAHVVQQLLNFDEVHSWSKFRTIQLNKLVQNTIREIKTEYNNSPIQIKTRLSQQLSDIRANEEQLQQIILYLLHNLRMNMITSGIGSLITLFTYNENKSVILKIAHDGPEFLENLSEENRDLHLLFAELLAQKNNVYIDFYSNTILCKFSLILSN